MDGGGAYPSPFPLPKLHNCNIYLVTKQVAPVSCANSNTSTTITTTIRSCDIPVYISAVTVKHGSFFLVGVVGQFEVTAGALIHCLCWLLRSDGYFWHSRGEVFWISPLVSTWSSFLSWQIIMSYIFKVALIDVILPSQIDLITKFSSLLFIHEGQLKKLIE